MEFTKDMMKVDGDFSINDDSTIITAYIETWFDVDEKFGTDINKDDDASINFYTFVSTMTTQVSSVAKELPIPFTLLATTRYGEYLRRTRIGMRISRHSTVEKQSLPSRSAHPKQTISS